MYVPEPSQTVTLTSYETVMDQVMALRNNARSIYTTAITGIHTLCDG